MWVSLFFVLLANVALGRAQGGGGGLTQVDPCTIQSGMVGDAQYCDRYWECVNETPELYDCPNGLVFVGRNRGIASGCDYPWRGSYCSGSGAAVSDPRTGFTSAGDKQTANPPIQTDHCGALYGIFGHETSCTRYWTCWNGTATEQFCIGGLLYHEDSHSCDWPENVKGCQKHPICKDNPFDNVPLGTSCQRYWACQGGYPRLQRCSANLFFDKLSKRCVNKLPEGCDPPPPPPPGQFQQVRDQENARNRQQAIPAKQRRRQNTATRQQNKPQQSRPVQQQSRPSTRQQSQPEQREPRRPLIQQRPKPTQLRQPQQQQEQFVEEPLPAQDQFTQPQSEQFVDEEPQFFEEELLPQEQFIDEQPTDQAQFQPKEQELAPEPQQAPPRSFRPIRPLRPARRQFSTAKDLPLPPVKEASPINFRALTNRRGARRPPVSGAIPVRS